MKVITYDPARFNYNVTQKPVCMVHAQKNVSSIGFGFSRHT